VTKQQSAESIASREAMRATSPKERGAFPITRRRFLARAAAAAPGLIVGTGVVGAVYGTMLEPRWVDWTLHRVPITGLPDALSGLRIVHITDIHASRVVPMDFVRAVVDEINEDPPDLVVLTGDFLTADAVWARRIAAELGRLRPTRGTFAILGNHDYWCDGAHMSAELEAVGIHHLRNASTLIDGLRLVGIDDHWTGNDDLERAMAGVGDEPTVLLMHSPDLVVGASGAGIDLALAGHTHGGQVRIPGWGALIVPSDLGYQMGWYEHGPTRMYVNRGLGTLELKVRTFCRPEVAEFVLEPRLA
jgi:hypothetical protein